MAYKRLSDTKAITAVPIRNINDQPKAVRYYDQDPMMFNKAKGRNPAPDTDRSYESAMKERK